MSSPLSGALGAAADSGGLQRRIGTITDLVPLVVTLANGTELVATGFVKGQAGALGDSVLVLVDDAGAAIVVGSLGDPGRGTSDSWRLNSRISQSIATASDTDLLWDVQDVYGVGLVSSTEIHLSRAGRWTTSISLRWNGAGTVGREHYAAIRRFNSAGTQVEVVGTNSMPSHSNGGCALSTSRSFIADAGDWLKVRVFQNSGVAKSLENDPTNPVGGSFWEGYWVSGG